MPQRINIAFAGCPSCREHARLKDMSFLSKINRLHEGCRIECSWHNAQFDARTGAVVSGPARKPLRKYAVKIVDGTVYIALVSKGPWTDSTKPRCISQNFTG